MTHIGCTKNVVPIARSTRINQSIRLRFRCILYIRKPASRERRKRKVLLDEVEDSSFLERMMLEYPPVPFLPDVPNRINGHSLGPPSQARGQVVPPVLDGSRGLSVCCKSRLAKAVSYHGPDAPGERAC